MKSLHPLLWVIFILNFTPENVSAQDHSTSSKMLPSYLADRGVGIRTSIFGTYVRKSEFLVYPFVEYYRDGNYEYKPEELGYNNSNDFRGKFKAVEGLFFLAYGFTDWLAVELECAPYISATLNKSPEDPSQLPSPFKESGFGDTQIQFDFRFKKESATRPEINGYFEVNFPFQRNRVLTGTQNWEFKAGMGLIKGFSFGTLGCRIALEYPVEEKTLKLGEYGVEYLKRISRMVRIYAGIEGSDDEIEFIPELQLFLNRHVFIKINSAFGLTSKAPDWAPELGIVFSIFKD